MHGLMCLAQGHKSVTPVRLDKKYSHPINSFVTSRVLSVENFCKQFGPDDPDQARQNVRPDLGPICLTLRWYS